MIDFDKALGIAISQCLSDWEHGMTNQQIWQAVFDEDFEHVSFWQPFENMDGEDLAQHIEDMALAIQRSAQ